MGFLTLLTEGSTAPGETWFMHLRMINVSGLASRCAVELVCCQPSRSGPEESKDIVWHAHVADVQLDVGTISLYHWSVVGVPLTS